MTEDKPSNLDKAQQAAVVFGPLLIQLAQIFADAIAKIHAQHAKSSEAKPSDA